MCKLHNATAATGNAAQGRDILPANVVPRRYDLTLEPDFNEFTFAGGLTIDLDIVEDTDSITLNSVDIDIQKATLIASETSDASEISYDADEQVVKFKFPSKVSKGLKATLSIAFTAELNDKLAGFYRSKYTTSDGRTGYLATTQFEPTDARRAFPCFDEPALKAKFDITLIAEKHLTCLSNMDVASEEEVVRSGATKKAVKFNTTPLMSTYLLAFVIGELNYIENTSFRVPFRVYAPVSENINHGRYSLDLGAKTLEFYEKQFDSPFPLPKMDMIAIPDFAAGAMENWGLVTYRTVYIMLDEERTSAVDKVGIADTVQHELAHQWFGNLVTMDFWDGLWLNEGFATWMALYSNNIFHPEWKVWETYVSSAFQRAMGLDGLRNSHPIEVPVKKASEINQIFDAISYEKGSAVIRMIAAYIGENVFMEGIRQYIKKHAYGNTQTEDLWAALSAVSGKPIDQIMGVWTKKVGFPVVTVTETDSGSILVRQNRYLTTADVKAEEDETIYPVFLSIRTKTGVSDITLDSREATFKLPGLEHDDFFKVNANSTGFYRVLYTPERLKKLGQSAKDGLLSVEDRAGIVSDAGALASSGYQSTSGFLDLIRGFETESEFVVWEAILDRLSQVQTAWGFEEESIQKGLEQFERDLVSPKAHSYGWHITAEDTHASGQLKALLFQHAGLAGDAKIIAAARELLSKYVHDKSVLHPNLRKGVFQIVLKHGGVAEYDLVQHIYLSSTDPVEKVNALEVLGYASSPDLIQRTLEFALSKDVREQDINSVIEGLRSHPAGLLALFEWLVAKWPALQQIYNKGFSMIAAPIRIATSRLSTQEQLAKVEEFFKDKDASSYHMGLAQSYDSIKARIAWVDRDRDDVAKWVKENGFSP